jgi:hypothetical protein
MAGINFTNQIKMRTPPTEPNHVARKQDIEPVFLTQAEYDALENPVGSGLYPSLTGKRVIVTDAISIDSAFAMVPDYPKRIAIKDNNDDFLVGSTEGVTKTYTPLSLGYIQLLAETASGSPVTTSYSAHTVNPIEFLVYESDTFPGLFRRQSQPSPVAAGQEITFNISSNSTGLIVQLFFLPPKFVKQLAPVVMEEPDYGLPEVQLPTKWIDGKPVYRMVFDNDYGLGNLDGLEINATARKELSTLIPNIDEIVDEHLGVSVFNISDLNNIGSFTSLANEVANRVQTAFVVDGTSKSAILFKNTGLSAFSMGTNITLRGWVEYTKTTD